MYLSRYKWRGEFDRIWMLLACLRVDDNEGELNRCIFLFVYIRSNSLQLTLADRYRISGVHTHIHTCHIIAVNVECCQQDSKRSENRCDALEHAICYISMVIFFLFW